MQKSDQKVIDVLKKVGAILEGHFVGTSGKHMGTYINKDDLFPHPLEVEKVCQMFAEKNKNLDIEVIAAPALGGIVLAQCTASFLSKTLGREILTVFTEKDVNNNQIFNRGKDKYVKNKKVLILEDLTTTGGSVKKVIESVRKAGGKVIAISVMVNKNPKEVNSSLFNLPFNFLGEMEVQTYEEKECPLCKNNIPINIEVGHGRKYLENLNK